MAYQWLFNLRRVGDFVEALILELNMRVSVFDGLLVFVGRFESTT